MAVELGVLLGQRDGAQSFEYQGSWQLGTTQCSLGFTAALVHSSARGLKLQVFSGASGQLRYDYAAVNDAYARWFTAVDSRALVALLWACCDDPASSGKFSAVWTGGVTQPVAYAAALQPYRLDVPVSSAGSLRLDLQVSAGSLGAAGVNLYVDDVTVYVDAWQPPVEPGFHDDAALSLAQHQTATGRYAEYAWSSSGVWKFTAVPVPSSWADVVNGWHRGGLPVLLNRDTTDPTQRFVTWLSGQPPAVTVKHPYFNQSELSFQLQALRGGLSF